jgi:hypothetical protein
MFALIGGAFKRSPANPLSRRRFAYVKSGLNSASRPGKSPLSAVNPQKGRRDVNRNAD